MTKSRHDSASARALPRVLPEIVILVAAAIALVAAAVVSTVFVRIEPLLAGLALTSAAMAIGIVSAMGRSRRLIDTVSKMVAHTAANPKASTVTPTDPELAEVAANLRLLGRKFNTPPAAGNSSGALSSIELRPADRRLASKAPMTRSGLYESPPLLDSSADQSASGDHPSSDMVSRLHPETLCWLESSPSEQDFLGLPLSSLRTMTFLDIVHPDQRELAREQLLASLQKGEAHGLIYRIHTARGDTKAIEMNVSVRYDADMNAAHLRCHITDVTAKLLASRELRRRTRELAQANEQLRNINRELAELKDRYRDLYQNAPAMYLSLDLKAEIRECNDTLLRTLGYGRKELVGRPVWCLLPEASRGDFAAGKEEFLRTGRLEFQTRWQKADGALLDVVVTSTVVKDANGEPLHYRSVAQDLTARRLLEAELKEKNEHLARANAELSSKNRELDEFTYVVSHDLQEPLRTLIAFSDFLIKDCGDRLDEQGRQYVEYLVDASRRMRALITDVLNLSRAGHVAGAFHEVDLDNLVATVFTDLGGLIRTKGAEVHAETPLPKVWGDRDRIGQLLGNLVGNGLKYNHASPPCVTVGSTQTAAPNWVTIYVRDNGIGIDAQYHDKVFQMFRRLHTREEYAGTGAGLAICQKIVLAHGGRIWVESSSGQGSTFYFTLPVNSDSTSHLGASVLHAS
jgi:PAS domain S-box-containing protein